MPENGDAGGIDIAHGHTADVQVEAVRNGWLPFYPQFDINSIDVVKDAKAAGGDPVQHTVDQLKSGKLKFSVEDPDAPENWPRVWFIWRGNALMSSAKGHEFFLKHYLGTHTNAIAEDVAEGAAKLVEWHEKAPQGKMDLVVDLNFRMDTSALYSDIVLPAATWYEKADLNSTDMHSFIHPLSAAVPPCWESKSDWQIFRTVAKKFSELAERHFPEPVEDLVASPLGHDSPAEIAQPAMKSWMRGEIEAIPGKTMPGLKVVNRDYKNLYNEYISFGPLVRANGLNAHGTSYAIDDLYDEALKNTAVVSFDGKRYPSLFEDQQVCDTILRFASVTNGELAYRSYKNMEAKTGLQLTHLAERNRGVRLGYKDLQAHPHRLLNSPMWSGLTENGRAYSAFTYNKELLVPWRTLTGRQHFYLDHPGYLQYGEHLPTYKPKPSPVQYGELRLSKAEGPTLMLNYLTPHGKWHIHSTYGDNHRMTTLSRGVEPFWINDRDAASIGILDNDWVEIHNDNGVVVTRAAVSARIPRGISIQYHSPERTYSVPKSPLRNYKRAGGHNSLTRVRLKPNLMVGGYGQFTFHFNYWGPTGCNRDTHILVRKLPDLKW
jgi:nitrate reductase alpha subunit